ncbi:NUDIX hydrolase [Methylobacterium sp. ID0610]|uniref:NUDIX hydrolase n=1 Tax=Methylobacterium carpenticola TaxID=3344827 RepID=UPI0036C4AA23
MAKAERVEREPMAAASAPTIGLAAVIIAATQNEPRVLTVPEPVPGRGEGLPSGPLEPAHPTLERGLRAWVERQTGQTLGYVEQLYTFGDRNRRPDGDGPHALSVAYLALVREARPAADSAWQNWYRYFPYEDWRSGSPACLDAIAARLDAWSQAAPDAGEARRRADRIGLAFGVAGGGWNEERVLERYELLFEAGLVPEAGAPDRIAGQPMALDHRRMLATGLGRLRGKIKYRPVVFELMPPAFTLGQLQRVVEALSGVLLHKQNFRRLVAQQGLVEETDAISAETGGRPARLMRFRREVLLERPAPGLRLPPGRRS